MHLWRWMTILLWALLPVALAAPARAATCDAMHRLWNLSGSSGQQVTVPFILARKTQAITPVSGMDFKLVWDPTLLAIDHFQAGESCYGQFGCFPNLFPDCTLAGCTWGTLPTGHSIIAVPKNIADWRDRGVLMMVHLGAPDIPLNSAYLDANGQVVGDDQVVFTATFTLQADIPPENPASVWMAGASFAQTSGFTLHESVTETGGSRVIVLDDQILAGDLNGSGNLDLADAILAMQATVGLSFTCLNLAADLDGDGRSGIAEAAYVLKHLSQSGG